MAKRQTTERDKSNKESPEELARKAENARLKRPIGVYVRKDVRIAIEEIAEKEGWSRHAVLSYAIDYFVSEYRKGKVKLETEQISRPKRRN